MSVTLYALSTSPKTPFSSVFSTWYLWKMTGGRTEKLCTRCMVTRREVGRRRPRGPPLPHLYLLCHISGRDSGDRCRGQARTADSPRRRRPLFKAPLDLAPLPPPLFGITSVARVRVAKRKSLHVQGSSYSIRVSLCHHTFDCVCVYTSAIALLLPVQIVVAL